MPDREKVIAMLERYVRIPNLAGAENYGTKIVNMPAPLITDALALLKAQEPLLITHIHEEYPEHLWKKDENGNVNEWAMEFDYHQGPVCERCGDTFCIHCEPDGYITHKKCVVDVYKCPKCGSELRSNQKHCAKCGQAVKWE